jgi:hypothetical protein
VGIATDAFYRSISLTNFSVDAANPVYSSLNGVLFNKAQTALIIFPPGRGGSYVIPDSVTSIGNWAFYDCTSVTNVIIGNGVALIGDQAFYGCANLASVTMGNSVTNIGSAAFSGCTNLTSVTIPNSVTSIGYTAFYRCTSLTSVTIGNSVTSIGGSAFSYCTSLTRLTIPNSVTILGDSAFLNCSNLTNFTFLGNRPGLAPNFEVGGYYQFYGVGAGAKVYYYCGTTGWGATYGGSAPLPTVMLCPPQIAPGSAGMKPGGFGFTLTFLTNQTIVVEASTNLPNWQPIWTNSPPGTSTNFVDPDWLNHSNRFYRARSD